jgi:hypothetical protein
MLVFKSAGANASTVLVPRLGYNPYTAAVDANGNLTTTNKKVGYRLNVE